MAFENVYVGSNVQTFKSSPKFDLIDMVVLALDEQNYISSPYARIVSDEDREKALNSHTASSAYRNYSWKDRFEYEASAGKWRQYIHTASNDGYTVGALYTNAELLSTFGITVYFCTIESGGVVVYSDAPKEGDTITLTCLKNVDTEIDENDKKQSVELTCELTRTGRQMEANCPLCKPSERQAIADALLSKLSRYQYQPYTATGAEVNPLAELGDGITSNGVYGGLYQQDIEFNSLMSSDVSAPADEELDHEYTYETESERRYSRKFAEISAEFEIKADEINARVTREGSGNGFAWSLTESCFKVYTTGSQNSPQFMVDSTGLHVRGDGTFSGTVYATDGEFKGTVKANRFFDGSGNELTSTTAGTVMGGFAGGGITGGSNFGKMTQNNYTAQYVVCNTLLCSGNINGTHYGRWYDDRWNNTVYWNSATLPVTYSTSISANSHIYVQDTEGRSRPIPNGYSASTSADTTRQIWFLGTNA